MSAHNADYVALLERAQVMLWRILGTDHGVSLGDIQELRHDIIALVGDGSVPAEQGWEGKR